MKPTALIFGIALIGLISAPISRADETHKTREEYVSTAKIEILLRDDLAAIPGKEAQVMFAELPKGWVGGRHYHTGDVFVYVLEGQFSVDVDGEGRHVFGPGQVYHEAVDKVMLARNPSTTAGTKLIVFQVGAKGEPLMIKAD